MSLIKIFTLLILPFTILFFSPSVYSQEEQKQLMSQAIQLFEEGQFEQAEPRFKELLKNNPDDFMVNYYYGACRTENNHFTNADLDALIKANQEVSPVNINHYFGIQYHARSNWERALKFYNKYSSTPGLAENEKAELRKKIQQCYNQINPYKEYVLAEIEKNTVSTIIGTDIPSEHSVIATETISDEPGVSEQETSVITEEALDIQQNERISFPVNGEITYLLRSNFRTEEGIKFYMEGNSKLQELDNILERTETLREKYNNASSPDDRKLIGQDILALESEAYSLKRESVQLLYQAKNAENEYWEDAPAEELTSLKNELLNVREQIEMSISVNEDTVADTATMVDPSILFVPGEATAAPAEEVPDNNLVYKIQIGAYSRGLPSYVKRLYDKLSLIRKIENYTDDRGVVVYTTGNLTNYEDALQMQKQVRQEGVEDAYVVPYFKGKRITLTEAKELEAEK